MKTFFALMLAAMVALWNLGCSDCPNDGHVAGSGSSGTSGSGGGSGGDGGGTGTGGDGGSKIYSSCRIGFVCHTDKQPWEEPWKCVHTGTKVLDDDGWTEVSALYLGTYTQLPDGAVIVHVSFLAWSKDDAPPEPCPILINNTPLEAKCGVTPESSPLNKGSTVELSCQY